MPKNKGSFRRPPRSAMLPLRITARMGSPVVGDFTLPIDGVLYYHAMRERYGPQILTGCGQDHSLQVTGVSLPILRHEEHGPGWYYAASFAQWPVFAQGSTHWNKRIPLDKLDYLAEQRGRIDVKSARYKAYHMPVWYRHAPCIVWYTVAEPEWLFRMLGFCTHLGKKTDQGWGEVMEWSVDEVASDWSVRDSSGRLMRAIPSPEGRMLHGFRPSYWLPKNQATCLVPE
jgi:CRISPR type IV-associated protein Csf3